MTTLCLAGLFAVAACAETADTTTTLGDTGTTLDTGTTMDPGTTAGDDAGTDPEAAADEIQEELTRLAEAIENSAAAEEIGTLWAEFETEISALLAEFQAEGTIDTSALEEQLQQFEDELESLGDQVEPELRDAWDSFRQRIEALMN